MKVHASMRLRLTGLALSFAALASACGDGGGISADVPAPAPPPAPALLVFDAFPAASVVIGQEGFDTVAPDGTPGTLNLPRGEPAVDADGRLFVADSGSSSLQIFSRYDQHGPSVGFRSGTAPRSVSIQSGKLVFVDGDKVRIFASTTLGAPEIAVAGSASGCSESGLRVPTSAVLTPNGRLIVADHANHRVMIWKSVGSEPLGDADVVLGQTSMTACEPNGGNPAPTDSTLFGPTSVWSDGNKLVVADSGNHRVLVWDSLPTSSSQPATTVLGQRGFADAQPDLGQPNPSAMSMDLPVSVDVNEAGQLAVVDQLNNRVLVWNRIPAAGAHGQPADQVIGQDGFTVGESQPLSARTFSEPDGVRFHGRDLVVVDQENNRVLVFRSKN